MQLSDSDKHFLVSLLYASGIIMFWRGIWGIADITPLLDNVFVSFFIGLLVLTLTGIIYREFDPLEQKLGRISRLLEHIVSEKKAHEYDIHYYDEILNKQQKVNAIHFRRMEYSYLVIKKHEKEFFIPVQRVVQVCQKGKSIWKK